MAVGIIMALGALTHFTLLHSVCDLKATQMNVQCSLIWELMFKEFKLGQNIVEAIKNMFYAKDEGAVNHSIVIR